MKLMKTLFLLGMAVSALADRSAPVLVWESAVSSLPAVPALPAMTNSQLQNHLNSLDSEALVMFIMNELNVEDFSGYPSAFSHLQQEFESSQNAFTPSMPDPSQLPAHLDAYSRVTVNPEDLASLKLAPGASRTLFLVYVGDRAAAERQTALENADALISRVLTKVKKLTSKYSAVLTGKHTTMGGEARQRTGRSLKAMELEDTASQFENLGCVFIYTSSPAVMRFTVTGDSGKSVWRLDLGEADIKATCVNDTDPPVNTVTMSWKDATGSLEPHTINLSTIQLELNFKPKTTGDKDKGDDVTVSSWTLTPVTLTYEGTLDGDPITGDTTLDFGDVYAPVEFSYHCTNRSWTRDVFVRNGTSEWDDVAFSALELPGFQVQAFLPSGAAETFGRAWDCTGFFTIPIWSGLFLSLILLLVLVWSLMMLASVPTMDRFDDPRGQPLHVPNAEG